MIELLVLFWGSWDSIWVNWMVQKWCFWLKFWISRVESRGSVGNAAARKLENAQKPICINLCVKSRDPVLPSEWACRGP